MNIVVAGLAVARLTSLIAEDEITAPLRDAVDRWVGDAPQYSLKERIGYLVSCPRCVSVYAAAGILIAGRMRWGRPLVKVLAASQSGLAALTALDYLERH